MHRVIRTWTTTDLDHFPRHLECDLMLAVRLRSVHHPVSGHTDLPGQPVQLRPVLARLRACSLQGCKKKSASADLLRAMC